MLKKVLATATIAGALAGGALVTAGPALAAGPVCYQYDANINGNVYSSNGQQCPDLPGLPSAPALPGVPSLP